MRDFIKPAGTLFLIAFVSAFLLAGVNMLTKDRIAQNTQLAVEQGMQSVLPEAEHFEEVDEHINKAIKSDEIIGYCVSVTTSGFGGDIDMLVGITSEGNVSGIEFISLSETPGLGMKAATKEFKSQFNNKPRDLVVVKNASGKDNEIIAITGATVTSKAVVNGVNAAVDILVEAGLMEGSEQ